MVVLEKNFVLSCHFSSLDQIIISSIFTCAHWENIELDLSWAWCSHRTHPAQKIQSGLVFLRSRYNFLADWGAMCSYNILTGVPLCSQLHLHRDGPRRHSPNTHFLSPLRLLLNAKYWSNLSSYFNCLFFTKDMDLQQNPGKCLSFTLPVFSVSFLLIFSRM